MKINKPLDYLETLDERLRDPAYALGYLVRCLLESEETFWRGIDNVAQATKQREQNHE